MPSAPVLVTAEEAAALLSVSPKTIFRLASRGELPRVKIGHLTRFRPEALAEFAARRERGGEA